ncbi:MAG: Type-2 serine--tRNA ligase [Candidatus Bathyarchaeota archaeon BA1]|nr:MAG: Type-2 serine--tRNA ligase [Candidatus Bathyarchaeota archaeon BA1]
MRHYPATQEVQDLNGEMRVILTNVDEAVIDRGDLDRVIRFMAPEARTISRELAHKVGIIIRQGAEKPIRFTKDPTEEAEKLGWITRFPGRDNGITCHLSQLCKIPLRKSSIRT